MNFVFYSQFHNGDCFLSKGWVQDLIEKIPNANFYYAHQRSPEILKDLNAQYLDMRTVPVLWSLTSQPIAKVGEDIAIHTWCGIFREEKYGGIIPPLGHSTFIRQYEIYKKICEYIFLLSGIDVKVSNEPKDYIPKIDFSRYDLSAADQFVSSLQGKMMFLFCNNDVMSGQSDVGDMENVLCSLSERFPDCAFVSTKKLSAKKDNIYYTNNIFNKNFDLNEIAYLSKFAKMIIGKNSGAGIFVQFQENLNDENKTFYFLSHREDDNPHFGLNFPATMKFSSESDDRKLIELFTKQICEFL